MLRFFATVLVVGALAVFPSEVLGQPQVDPAAPTAVEEVSSPTPQPEVLPPNVETNGSASQAAVDPAREGSISQTVRDWSQTASSVAVALFTCALVFVSWRQWNTAEKTARTAVQAATTAHRSADIAERTLKDLNRAWLHVDNWRLKEVGDMLLVQYTVFNHGHSPATLLRLDAEHAVNRTLARAGAPELLVKGTVGQDLREEQLVPSRGSEKSTLVANLSIGDDPWPALRSEFEEGNGLLAQVNVQVRYRDYFGEERTGA